MNNYQQGGVQTQNYGGFRLNLPSQPATSQSQKQPVAQQGRFNYETSQVEAGPKYYDSQTGLTTDQNSYFGTNEGPVDSNANYFNNQQNYQQPQQMSQNTQQYQQNGYMPQDSGYMAYQQPVQNLNDIQRWEPNFFPEKLLPKKTEASRKNGISKGFEFVMDGFNLTTFDKPKDSSGRPIEGQEGRRVSFDSKFHMNFWTYTGPQNTQKDFIQIYGDTSRLCGFMQCVLNGQIYNLTQMAIQANPSYPVVWDNVGGTDKAGRYKINGYQVNAPYLATELAVMPAKEANAWLLCASIYEGNHYSNGAIFKKNNNAIGRIQIKFNYFELCSLATYVLNSVQADMNATYMRRAMAKQEHEAEVKGGVQ